MDKSSLSAFFSDLLYVFGLATLLMSAVLPFLTVSPRSFIHLNWPGTIVFPQQDFSTFKMTYDPSFYPQSYYFGDYWFRENWLTTHSFLPVSYALVAAFVLQIMTLTVGFGVFLMKRLLRVVPLILCLAIILLLTWIVFSVWTDGRYSWNVAIGYWLNFPSPLLVMSSVILKRNTKT